MIVAGMHRQGDFARHDPVTFLTGRKGAGRGRIRVEDCVIGGGQKGGCRDGVVVMETVPRGFLNSKLDWLGQS